MARKYTKHRTKKRGTKKKVGRKKGYKVKGAARKYIYELKNGSLVYGHKVKRKR